MRCSEVTGLRWRNAAAAFFALAASLFAFDADAHKASDSYLQLKAASGQLEVRWDIALRDLDAALAIDADGDGKITWGEVKAAWPRIEAYASPHLEIEGCALVPVGRALERRNDGAYAVMQLTSACTLPNPPVIAYTLLREVDPTHRGIAKVERVGQPVALQVLDPTHPPEVRAGPGGPASATSRNASAAGAANPAEDDSHSTFGFMHEGVRHILTGYDHVLFLLCLLLPAVMTRTKSGWRPVDKLSQAVLPVIGIVSAFTVAHSITLGFAATKLISLSPAFIEPAIAVTIILAALDNVWPFFPVRRIVVTFFFGLIHGFGFAGVLAELNLPTGAFAWALLQFNVGLELGQLLIVVSVIALLFSIRRWAGYANAVIRSGSGLAIVIGALWLIERVSGLSLWPL